MPHAVAHFARKLTSTAQNWLEVTRFGGLETGEEPTAFDIVDVGPIHRLRRYAIGDRSGPPILLVPPLMLTADVFDVSPPVSAVRTLGGQGIDVWVIDFGSPEHETGGLERTLADHVRAVSAAVASVVEETDSDVHLCGYSQGGMFCYQTAAYRRNAGVASVITFGSPINLRGAVPLGISEGVAIGGIRFVLDRVLRGNPVPGWATRTGFRLLDPVKALRQQLDFLVALHDRDALLPREGQRRYLMGEGWVAWPGPALDEFMRQFLMHNRMLTGGFTVGDRPVTLADIECPILTFIGEVDDIAPPAAVRPIRQAAPQADVYEVALAAGHFGLVVSTSAQTASWPVVAQWAQWLSREAARPPQPILVSDRPAEQSQATLTESAEGIHLVTGAGKAAFQSVTGTLARSAHDIRNLASITSRELPRLARIGDVRTHTRLSLGQLLDERARRSPRDVCFLYEDRVYTYLEIKQRIDGVVRGLLSEGVRVGEHVGILMHTRPTALAVVAALNRIGAVAVMLRPGADTARELDLGEVHRLVVDPAHANIPAGNRQVHVFLLDTPDHAREPGLTALEQPESPVQVVPVWYEPNPGNARDLAFILFGGDFETPRVIRITNGRFGISAFGTAASASLSNADTVFSINPFHHPSGLLTSVGGAFAGGARLAMATSLDPETFWTEVRRYGVTVVSYTWAQLRPLVNAKPQPGERHHPVRLFVGSGMPRSLWRRVSSRFAPATVLDFWATSEGEAVLVNIDPTKPGALGRPLPGGAELRVARWDPTARTLLEDRDGYSIECGADEVGLLLARVQATTTANPLRNLFERGDAWYSSGNLVRRDIDGDYWLIDSVDSQIRTATGVVASLPITAAIGKIPAVDLAITYAVPTADGAEIAVTAVVPLQGCELDGGEFDHVLMCLPLQERPAFIRIVSEIPLTPWHRPIPAHLPTEPLQWSTSEHPVFKRSSGGTYAPYINVGHNSDTHARLRAVSPISDNHE